METPANADMYTVTGNQLLTMCVEQNNFSQGQCYGYVMAVADHYLASHIEEPLRICMSGGVTRKQIVDVTVAFLQSRPEKRHYIAEGVVWEALRTAWLSNSINRPTPSLGPSIAFVSGSIKQLFGSYKKKARYS